MKPRVVYPIAFAAYLVATLAFVGVDRGAATLFAMMAPAAAVFVLVAIWQKHLTLTLFSLFFFATNGLSPAFFFLERDIYSYSGWGAVGDFDFKVASYLPIAAPVFALMAVITVVCLLTTKAASRPGASTVASRIAISRPQLFAKLATASRSASATLFAFVVLVAIPLSIFMLDKGIGIVGVDNRTRLPFRLSGILYYFRYFVIPLLLFYLYAKSRRPLWLSAVILVYAAVAGLTSVSRSLLILSAIAVPVYAFLDRKYWRLAFSAALLLSLYGIVTAARVFVYSFEALNVSTLLLGSQLPTLETFAAITSRLGGAQDNVLAYQHAIANPFGGIIKFVLGLPLFDNYALELYGFNLPEGMAFGIGLTLFPSMLLLAGRNLIVLIILGAVIGSLLVVFEKLVRSYLSSRSIPLVLSAYPLAFLLVFTLFGANLRPLYFFLTVATLTVVGYQLVEAGRVHGVNAASTLPQT